MTNPYAVLGIQKTVDLMTVKAAYHKKLLAVHPDKVKSDTTATVQQVQQAYCEIKAQHRVTVVIRVSYELFCKGGVVPIWYLRSSDTGVAMVNQSVTLPAISTPIEGMRVVHLPQLDIHVYRL